MAGKIFCLMGKSSSGKDTVFKALLGDSQLSLKPIIPFTTRPKRCNESDGVDYYFITDAQLAEFNKAGKIIEQRQYDTVQGTWNYATVDNGQIDLTAGNYLIIGTLPVYLSLKAHFGVKSVLPIYIEVDDAARLERALARERKQPKPDYNEMCRRFLADSNDFCVAKLVQCGIIKCYYNNRLEECINDIKADMLKEMTN